MEDSKLYDELTRALWYGLTGRAAEVRRVLTKTMPELVRVQPTLAARIERLLADSLQQGGGITREAQSTAAAPVDPDSRLDLVNMELQPQVPYEPIWSPEIARGLHQLIAERRAKDLLEEEGLTPSRTVLFTGPPGVGKTMAARWLARELSLPLYILNLSTVVSSFLGRTGGNIRQVFAFAQKQPCILFLDELDAIAKRRDDESDVGELKRLVTVLLQEFDAWPSNNLLISATNHAELLDRAVWRRFEVHLTFTLPTFEQLRQAVALFLGTNRAGEGEQPDVVAAAFSGSSFSDVEHAMRRARREALLTKTTVSTQLLSLADDRIVNMANGEKQRFAQALLNIGLGQREIHRRTGLARETIRKLSAHEVEQATTSAHTNESPRKPKRRTPKHQ